MVRMYRPLCLLLLTSLASAETLDEKIRAAIAGFPGTVGIFAKNLDSGTVYALNGDDAVRTASTIKLPILVATFAAVKQGKVAWTDLSTLHDSDKISGSGVLREFSDGVRLPLADLAHLMIVVSDNTATNLVLDRVTADYVNDQMDKFGLPHTRSMRKVLGNGTDKGFSRAGKMSENERFGLGSSTPHEMVTLLEKIERGEAVSEDASKEILKILKRQQDHNGIARRAGDLAVANKAGALDRLRSDVGIVYSPRGRIAMAITCDGIPKVDWTSDNQGLLLIARVAEILIAAL
jgi:beta-lactamase class A